MGVSGRANAAGTYPMPTPIPNDGLCVPLVTSPTFAAPGPVLQMP